jgi:hypothetical protein
MVDMQGVNKYAEVTSFSQAAVQTGVYYPDGTPSRALPRLSVRTGRFWCPRRQRRGQDWGSCT